MGADFLLAGCPRPIDAEGSVLDEADRAAVLHHRIDGIDDELLAELAEFFLFIDHEVEAFWQAEVRTRLASYLDVFSEPWRDASDFLIDGRWWLFAGGMSSGDSPSDSYDKLAALAATGITEAPLEAAELSRADDPATTEEG